MSYYDELFLKIDDLLKNKDQKKALDLIEEELKLPYIPKDIEVKLREYYNDLFLKDSFSHELSDEEIEDYLFKDEMHQLIAVNTLADKNLRNYLEIAEHYLCSEAFVNAKVLLVESLIRQEISTEIRMSEKGMEYCFIPKYLLLPEESDGFIEALKIIEDYYLKEPSKIIFSKELLYKECLLALPISYTIEESTKLAHNIIEYIEKCFDGEEE